jgi:hypothetical protein
VWSDVRALLTDPQLLLAPGKNSMVEESFVIER